MRRIGPTGVLWEVPVADDANLLWPELQPDGMDGAFMFLDDGTAEMISYRHIDPAGNEHELTSSPRSLEGRFQWTLPRPAGGWVQFHDGSTQPSIALLDDELNELCRRELPDDTAGVLGTYFVDDILHVMWIDRIATFELGDPHQPPEN